AYEYVYYYERSDRRMDRSDPVPDLRYWIDEEPDGAQLSTAVSRSLKQQQIGAILNRYQSTSSRWKIEKTHNLGGTRIYRIRLPAFETFRTASRSPASNSSKSHIFAANDFEQRSRWYIRRIN
ncbi:MAG: hypothetical protein VX304_04745, partial [Planctomycetota bacterium]|nr:hypothetical protein [Planctomycetota bacterium]